MATARSIAEAVSGCGLEKVVVASTYGAHPGDRIGDLSVLYEFERMIKGAGIPAAINRGAYYFTNIDPMLEPARGWTITSPFPGDVLMPMVPPLDLGRVAAARLLSSVDDVGIQYVEGPERYTFTDIAVAFGEVLGRSVLLKTSRGTGSRKATRPTDSPRLRPTPSRA